MNKNSKPTNTRLKKTETMLQKNKTNLEQQKLLQYLKLEQDTHTLTHTNMKNAIYEFLSVVTIQLKNCISVEIDYGEQ